MTAAAYAPHGGLVTIGYGNNLVRDYSYNSRLQTSSLLDAVNNNPANILFEMSLNWGANGNLNSTTTSHGGPGYPAFLTFHDYYYYDGLNRLTAGNGKDVNNNLLWAQNFQYDAYGNSWVASVGGLPSFNTTPGSNIFTAKNQMNNVSYDAAGNQTSVNGAAVSYDAENRQTQVNEPLSAGGAQVSFGYDGLSQRVSKTNGSAITVYVYDAPGRMVAQYSSVAPGTAPCRTCFLSVDQLGSTRLVTDIGASVVGRHDYVPFGQEIPGGWAGRNSDWGANDSVNQKFTGQERDPDTNIDYFKARYYGSLLGRFTSPDPYAGSMDVTNPQSFNRYAYVLGNPLGNTDPSGMDPFSGDPGDGGWDGDPCLFDPFLCGGGISLPSWPQPSPAPSQPGTTTVPNPGAGMPPQSSGAANGGFPPRSFPGGENLGLPPGMSVPGPLSWQSLLGLWAGTVPREYVCRE